MSVTKRKLSKIIPLLLSLFSIGFFWLLCVGTAADAQGAIGLFLFLPVYLGAAIAAKRLGGPRIKRFAQGLLIFYAVFYLAAFLPPTRPFSDGVIKTSAKIFEMIKGKSPYRWEQDRLRNR